MCRSRLRQGAVAIIATSLPGVWGTSVAASPSAAGPARVGQHAGEPRVGLGSVLGDRAERSPRRGGRAHRLDPWTLVDAVPLRAHDSRPAGPDAGVLLSRTPIAFEANRGQAPAAVRYLARGSGYSLLLTRGQAVLASAGPSRRAGPADRNERRPGSGLLRMRFVHSNPAARITAERPLAGVANYLVGDDPSRWRRGVPTFERVRYERLWPGIDALFYGNASRLEYDFVLAPGARTTAIRFRFPGARRVRIGAGGDLLVTVGRRVVRSLRPVAWQRIGGRRVAVRSDYARLAGDTIGIRVGRYDTSRPLTIDPVVTYAGTIDGNGNDGAAAVAVDARGSAYLVGTTLSTNLPSSPTSTQPRHAGGYDAFVAKLDPAGTLEYLTYLGGSGSDRGYDIALDDDANAYVTGATQSADFPTVNPAQAHHADQLEQDDVFVAKLDPSGSALEYSTYVGGIWRDTGLGIAVDAAGSAYVTGQAFVTFPAGGSVPSSGAAFVTKLEPSGAHVASARFLQGTDTGTDIAVDAAGHVFVVGSARPTPAENPLATAGAFQTAYGGGMYDAFAAQLDASDASTIYATYLGGGGGDVAHGVAVDPAGAAYVVGDTSSTDFPTAAPIRSSVSGPQDGFVSKLEPAGDELAYSTYLGGSNADSAASVAVDATGSAYATGWTSSTSDFPTVNAIHPVAEGGGSGFLSRLEPGGSAFAASTYVTEVERSADIALGGQGDSYLVGQSLNGARAQFARYPGDVTPPETTIVSGPSTMATSNLATFTFTTSEPGPGSSFECRLDGGAFVACESPHSYRGLPDGRHTFSVRSIDAAGNVGSAPTYTWTVAADPPDTIIIGDPPSITNGSASFEFACSRSSCTYDCRLDGAGFIPCVTPKAYTGLAEGPHSFEVRATDGSEQTDADPAMVPWMVDLTPPDTTITVAPLQRSEDPSATFEFVSSDAVATFECSLDDRSFSPCTSPKTYSGLDDRRHLFRVRSADAVHNVDGSPARHEWSIETSRPETIITSAPAMPSRSSEATFAFTASEESTFECRLDPEEEFTPCQSPMHYDGLAEGKHQFAVRAVDSAGKRDESPATWTWTVDLTAPLTFATAQPADGAVDLPPLPAFAWAQTTDSLTGIDRYELWIDDAPARTIAAAACVAGCSRLPLQPLATGGHTWHVRAFDGAGNVRRTPSQSFTVDATPPAEFGASTPVDGAYVPSRRPTLAWNATSDGGSGLSGYDIDIDGDAAGSVGPVQTTFVPATDLREGAHSWRVTARDANANARTTAARSFVVDVTAPSASFTAAPNPALAGRTVTFDARGSSDANAIARFEWDLDGDGDFETDAGSSPTTTRAYPDPGIFAVQLRVTDRAGLTAVASIPLRIVAAQDRGRLLGVTINDHARFTRDPNVTITATWPTFATEMVVSNDGSFEPHRSFPLLSKVAWTLDSGGSERVAKIVYVRFIRGFTVSETYTDDIFLDQSAPMVSVARAVPKKGGSSISLRVKARDRGLAGVSQMQIANNRRLPETRFRAYHATLVVARARRGQRGIRTVRPLYVRVRDRAGNTSRWRHVSTAAGVRG